LTEDMPRKLPLFVTRERSRHGRVMFFFRRGKGKRTRLPDAYPSAEFDAAYQTALTGVTPKKSPVVSQTDRLEWLVARFMESGRWAATSPATRRQRELLYLSALRNGNPRFGSITRKHMQAAVEERAKTPALAKNFLKAMRALFIWAVKNDHVAVNPCDGVEPVAYKTEGYPPWTIEDVPVFCERWPVGTAPRLALELFLTSGLRRGDMHRAGRQHLRGNVFSLRTGKTGTDITVQFPESLLRTIAATKTGDLHFLVKADGKPFASKESFGNWFSARCRDAGIPKSAHGLRKLSATLSANDGASAHELMAQYGWAKMEQAETYTRRADRQRLGIRSSVRVAEQMVNIIPLTDEPGSGKIENIAAKTTSKK
jgi:site-specific recombinase XerD